MVSTFTSYSALTRDLSKSLDRVAKQPTVKRDTEYFNKNIGKVKSVDEFMKDSRLYNYAMKAYGLEDMIYGKAFMKKVLTEGVSSADSFANKLTDKRYAEFAKAFNFSARKERATDYAPAQEGVMDRYTVAAANAGVDVENPVLLKQNADYETAVAKVTSIDEFLNDDAVYNYAMKAFGLDTAKVDKSFMRQVLAGGVADEDSFANRQKETVYAEFAAAFDFAGKGKTATTYRAAVEGTVGNYARQKLEQDAGDQNEGVRLALNFERKASTIKSWYSVLADTALAKVVRTAFGFPDSFASADIDHQVAAFQKKFDVANFQDPKQVDKLIKRFTAMYDAASQQSDTAPALQLLQGRSYGLSTSLALTMQQLKF